MPAGSLALQPTFYYSSAGGRRMVTILLLLLQRCHYIRHGCWSFVTLRYGCLYYQTCMLGSFIQIHMFVKCFSIRQDIWSVTNPPDMPTGKVPLPRVCETCQLPYWTPSWIYQILSDTSIKIIASLGCYKDDVCNSRISNISILHANPCSLPVSEKIYLYFCNKLPIGRPFCLLSYFIFLFC